MRAPGEDFSRTDTAGSAADCSIARVAILDDVPESVRVVSRAVSSGGAVPTPITDFSSKTIRSGPGTSIAVVALTEPGASSRIEAVRAFSENSVRVICYAPGIRSWPLGEQCRPLLAGAWKVLDSDAADFVTALRQLIVRHLEEESVRAEDYARIKSEMKSLGIVGESASLISVFRWVSRVSRLSDLPALIAGETGTGKELFAQAIHCLDRKRSNGPFVPVNCGAISAGLIESELFGHRRGAFTGADRERRGLIRAADSGVLFLDEVGELEPAAQTKLLRVLQERRILSVGDDRETRVDIRIIAATNRNLEEMVKEGRFRLDLYHRLNVLSVKVPPLRERKEDLRPLIDYFVSQADPGRRRFAISAEFVDALSHLPLHGNAREVENLVRRVLLEKGDESELGLSDLPVEVWEQLSNQASNIPERPNEQEGLTETACSGAQLAAWLARLLDQSGWDLPRSLDYCERLLVEAALGRAGGSQSRTARLLGITPRSVYNKIRKHGLAPGRFH